MNNKKIMIVFIIIVLLYGGFVLLFTNIFKDDNNEDNPSIINPNKNPSGENEISYKYLLIENTNFWIFNNDIWNERKKFETDDKLSIFINNKYFGDYYLTFINNWNLKDDNNKYVDYNGDFLAVSQGFSVKPAEFNIGNIDQTDIFEINTILNSSVLESSLSVNEKVVIDLDRNGINDKIINVSNLDSENESVYFNLVYVVLNGTTNILIKDFIDVRDVFTKPIYNIQYILNIENEQSDSIILQKGYFSNNGKTSSILYQYNNQYEKVIGY